MQTSQDKESIGNLVSFLGAHSGLRFASIDYSFIHKASENFRLRMNTAQDGYIRKARWSSDFNLTKQIINQMNINIRRLELIIITGTVSILNKEDKIITDSPEFNIFGTRLHAHKFIYTMTDYSYIELKQDSIKNIKITSIFKSGDDIWKKDTLLGKPHLSFFGTRLEKATKK